MKNSMAKDFLEPLLEKERDRKMDLCLRKKAWACKELSGHLFPRQVALIAAVIVAVKLTVLTIVLHSYHKLLVLL